MKTQDQPALEIGLYDDLMHEMHLLIKRRLRAIELPLRVAANGGDKHLQIRAFNISLKHIAHINRSIVATAVELSKINPDIL